MPPTVKPLKDAVDDLGAMPGFFLRHPFVAGVFTMVLCPVFAAVLMFFVIAVFGDGSALPLVNAIRLGGLASLVLGALIMFWSLTSREKAIREDRENLDKEDLREARKFNLLFAFGGALGIATVLAFDFLTHDAIYEWAMSAGRLM